MLSDDQVTSKLLTLNNHTECNSNQDSSSIKKRFRKYIKGFIADDHLDFGTADDFQCANLNA